MTMFYLSPSNRNGDRVFLSKGKLKRKRKEIKKSREKIVLFSEKKSVSKLLLFCAIMFESFRSNLLNNVKDGSLIQYLNCKLLRNGELIDSDLLVLNGKVVNPEKMFFDDKRSADLKIDCNGMILCPGFIDLQLNGTFYTSRILWNYYTRVSGGYGVDFTSVDPEEANEKINQTRYKILSTGVTSFCPTIITSNAQIYRKV